MEYDGPASSGPPSPSKIQFTDAAAARPEPETVAQDAKLPEARARPYVRVHSISLWGVRSPQEFERISRCQLLDLEWELSARRIAVTRLPRYTKDVQLQDFLNSAITAEIRARAGCSCGSKCPEPPPDAAPESSAPETGVDRPLPPQNLLPSLNQLSSSLAALGGKESEPVGEAGKPRSSLLELLSARECFPLVPPVRPAGQDPFRHLNSNVLPVLSVQVTGCAATCDLCCAKLKKYLLESVPELSFNHSAIPIVPCPPPEPTRPHLPDSLPCDVSSSLANVQNLAAQRPSFLSGEELENTACQTLHRMMHMTQFDRPYTALLGQNCFWSFRVLSLPRELSDDVPVPEGIMPFLLTGVLTPAVSLPYADYLYRAYNAVCSRVSETLPEESKRLVQVCFDYDLRTAVWLGSATVICVASSSLSPEVAAEWLALIQGLFPHGYLNLVKDYDGYMSAKGNGPVLSPVVSDISAPANGAGNGPIASLPPPASADANEPPQPPNRVIAVLNVLTDREMSSQILMDAIVASFWDIINDEFSSPAVVASHLVSAGRYSIENDESMRSGVEDEETSAVVRFCGMDLTTSTSPGEGMLFFELRPDAREEEVEGVLSHLNTLVFLGRAIYAVQLSMAELVALKAFFPSADGGEDRAEPENIQAAEAPLLGLEGRPAFWKRVETWEDWLPAPGSLQSESA